MRDKLIMGSHAMKHWFPDFPREPMDLDYMSRDGGHTKEVEHLWNPMFEYFLEHNKDDTYLDPEYLLLIKTSHLGWDIKWEKHVDDVRFLRSKGITNVDRDLYFKLVKEWTKIHGRKWASLKGKNSKTFFMDAVIRKYVHDSIHDAVAVYDRPLYESLLHEGVQCSEKGFDKLSYDDKILLVKEEVWVTALERYLISEDFKCSAIMAYQKSLKKLATTMSSGWFKYFILCNIDVLRACRSKEYIDKFKGAVERNEVELIKE